MTMPSILVAFLLSVSGRNFGQKPTPLHLKIGDAVSVIITLEPSMNAPLSVPDVPPGLTAGGGAGAAAAAATGKNVSAGDYEVLSDGSIYGPQFGRLLVAGKTMLEAQELLRTSMKRYVKSRYVFLTMKTQKHDLVYVVGEGPDSMKAPIQLQPNMTLRQVLFSATGTRDADELEVRVYRDQQVVKAGTVRELLATDGSQGDLPLAADDVVAVIPKDYLRVWVSGTVKLPARVRIPAGSDVYQAITAAGGVIHDVPPATPGATTPIDAESTVVVRRGEETFKFSARQDPAVKPFILEAGDSVSVLGPELIRVTIGGEISKPNEYGVNSGTPIPQLLALSGGAAPIGTLKRVLLFRKGEMQSFDLAGAPPQDQSNLVLENDDLVFVTKNERLVYVLGEVNKSGSFAMEDNKHYRLTDMLAQAGGLSVTGTLRRVYLSHPGPNGKAIVTMYNLDEYLKDGREASNPEVQPGDAVLFTSARVSMITAINQVFSSFVLAATLRGL